MSANLTIFVCSDFHAQDGKQEEYLKNKVSFFDTSEAEASLPTRQFIDFIRTHSIKADIAIFCGDLGDKAHPAAAKAAWEAFRRIASELGATAVLATAGNHDLDSHYKQNHYDPKGFLQSLEPRFPIEDESKFNEYWSRHVCLYEGERCRVMLLNSSAYHGNRDAENEHGRISEYTLQYVEKILKESPSKEVNILVVHHPLSEQTFSSQGEGDYIKNGDALVKILDSGQFGEWIILYGHKHYPRLSYGQGNTCPPVMLSCASFSATPYSLYEENGVNQSHFLEFDLDYIKKNGLHGIIKTYDWTTSGSWRIANGRGLGGIVGFGWREGPKAIAGQITTHIQGTTTWDNLKQLAPKLCYITSELEEKVILTLKEDHGIKIIQTTPEDGSYQLQRP